MSRFSRRKGCDLFAAMLTGEAGGEILYPDPGFPIYASAVRFSGATPCPYPLREENDFAFSADDVLSASRPGRG